MLDKVYPVSMYTKESNVQITEDAEPFTKFNPCVRRKRFRRTVVVINFINYIVKNIYQINDDDINKKIN